MRRAPFVVAATAAGLGAMLSFHSHSTTQSLALPGPKASGGTKTGSRSTNPTRPAGSSTRPGSSTSAVGAAEQYGYGILSARVTVRGSKIASVQIARLQTADSYSQQLAVQVIPYLRREVLASQTAHLNGISGATYTSEAYASSVQSALDKLHWRR